jgi:hypothetical protein
MLELIFARIAESGAVECPVQEEALAVISSNSTCHPFSSYPLPVCRTRRSLHLPGTCAVMGTRIFEKTIAALLRAACGVHELLCPLYAPTTRSDAQAGTKNK